MTTKTIHPHDTTPEAKARFSVTCVKRVLAVYTHIIIAACALHQKSHPLNDNIHYYIFFITILQYAILL